MTAANMAKPARARSKAATLLTYQRPQSEYVPNINATLPDRINTLRAAIYESDEKLELAREAVEGGTPAAVLLDLVEAKLTHDAWSTLLRNEDEQHLPLTKADVAAAYEGFSPLLATLEGVMALSLGTVIYPTVADAFTLLDWAQEECDAAALGALLPSVNEAQPVSAPKPHRDLAQHIEQVRRQSEQSVDMEAANVSVGGLHTKHSPDWRTCASLAQPQVLAILRCVMDNIDDRENVEHVQRLVRMAESRLSDQSPTEATMLDFELSTQDVSSLVAGAMNIPDEEPGVDAVLMLKMAEEILTYLMFCFTEALPESTYVANLATSVGGSFGDRGSVRAAQPATTVGASA